MKIVKLEAENVKRLRAVTIEPSGNVVQIRGNNGQGKTSVLDSIAMALGGKTLQPPRPIREGEDEAIVRVTLDGLTITRKWTSNERSTLEVRDANGDKVSSPQTLLESLVGRLSFDPLAYLNFKPADQLVALQKVVGLDFSELNEQRKKAFDERTEVNRKVHHTKVQLEPLRDFSDTQPVSIAELSAQVLTLTTRQGEERAAAQKLKAHAAEVSAAEKRVSAQEQRLEALRRQVEQESAALQELKLDAERLGRVDLSELRAIADNEIETIGELDTLKAKIRDAEKINESARKVAERARLEKVLADHEGESDTLTRQIEKIDAMKRAAIEAAKFPVDGLSFADAGVLYNGQPFEQASQAEKLRVSLGMGLALNPKLKVILIRDASLLDETSMRLVAEQAEAAGAQVWLEVVGKNGVGIVIEDGAVEAVNAETEAPI